MAHSPESESIDHAKPEFSGKGAVESGTGPKQPAHCESDVAQLAANFAEHGGGSLPKDLSSDLALEIVLNEIVEQACLATGAMGAAIVLERSGEMVCRASSGTNAPELGTSFGDPPGLTAICLSTGRVVRCDDALADSRADAEAFRQLGVRSAMVFPLPQKTRVLGVIQVWSARPAAFGDRDEITLEALARRVLKNLAQSNAPLHWIPPVTQEPAVSSPSTEEPAAIFERSWPGPAHVSVAPSEEHHRPDAITLLLTAAVVVSAVLFATLVGTRLTRPVIRTSEGQAVRQNPANAVTVPARSEPREDLAKSGGSVPQAPAAHSTSAMNEKKNLNAAANPVSRNQPNLPAGGLLVYENGKEVFRMAPTSSQPASEASGGADVQRASSVESTQVLQLSPDVAEGSLLHRVEPDYPEEARKQQIQGPVALSVRISSDGAVQDVSVISGHRLLSDAAIAAIKQWRFKPRVMFGQRVEMETKVTLNFRLPPS